MAARDPSRAQVNDAQLEADLLRTLEIVGPLGRINVIDAVMPVILMGSVRPFEFLVAEPAFVPGNIVNDVTVAPAINIVLSDTGALAAGTFDIQAFFEYGALAGTQRAANLELRNAANTATLAAWRMEFGLDQGIRRFAFALVLAASERLRFITQSAFGAGESVATTIMARNRA